MASNSYLRNIDVGFQILGWTITPLVENTKKLTNKFDGSEQVSYVCERKKERQAFVGSHCTKLVCFRI